MPAMEDGAEQLSIFSQEAAELVPATAPQTRLYLTLTDELADEIAHWDTFDDAKYDEDDWFDYYNNDRYQWQSAKLPSRQYYHYITTGEYPLPRTPPKV